MSLNRLSIFSDELKTAHNGKTGIASGKGTQLKQPSSTGYTATIAFTCAT